MEATVLLLFVDNFEVRLTPSLPPSCASNVVATPDAACGNFANSITWDAAVGAECGIAGVVRRAATGRQRQQVLGQRNLAPADHQRVVPDLGAGDGLCQLARRCPQESRRRQRGRTAAHAARRVDRPGAQRAP